MPRPARAGTTLARPHWAQRERARSPIPPPMETPSVREQPPPPVLLESSTPAPLPAWADRGRTATQLCLHHGHARSARVVPPSPPSSVGRSRERDRPGDRRPTHLRARTTAGERERVARKAPLRPPHRSTRHCPNRAPPNALRAGPRECSLRPVHKGRSDPRRCAESMARRPASRRRPLPRSRCPRGPRVVRRGPRERASGAVSRSVPREPW